MEASLSPRAARWFVLLFTLGWLALFMSDWYLRFARYEWHVRLIAYPVGRLGGHDAERPLFTTNTVGSHRGGDLSNLIGIRSAAQKFEEERPGYIRIVDRYGYQNRPYDPEVPPDIVIVGDSFMAAGSLDTQFGSQLADLSGLHVYNHALMGHGPFISIYRFIDAPRFRSEVPQLLIWGFAEREISGTAFVGMIYQLHRRELGRSKSVDGDEFAFNVPRFNWLALYPRSLQSTLPNSSIMAQAGHALWNRVRYLLFRKFSPDVTVASEPIAGGPMLFYSHNFDVLRRQLSDFQVSQIRSGMEYLRDYLSARGIQLLVVLIPEKEQAYRHAIPSHIAMPDTVKQPSVLWSVEAVMEDLGIPVVNLLHPLRAATERDELVYWRDDTHWNPQGAEMAAERVWKEVMTVFPDLVKTGDIE